MPTAGERTLTVYRLGRQSYGPVHSLQQRLQAERIEGKIGDTLLFVEHDHVITLGRAAQAQHVRMSHEALSAAGYERFEIGRGGDATYHGPGQLVVYPVIDLKPDRCDVRKYVHDLEAIMIRIAAVYRIEAQRAVGRNGTWVKDARGERKIGAVGVRISRWVTMHGFAFNINTDLSRFDAIVPCGLSGYGVTSLERELGHPVSFAEVEDQCEAIIADIWPYDVQHGEGDLGMSLI